MMLEEKLIGQIQKLEQYLPECSREELKQILEYGDEIRAQGEKKKQEFWSKHSRESFEELLRYKSKYKEDVDRILGYENDTGKDVEGRREVLDKIFGFFGNKSSYGEKKYEYLDAMSDLEKKKFIEEYLLYDNILYSGKLKYKVVDKNYDYGQWKEGNVAMKKGVWLSFCYDGIGAEGAKEIVENLKLEDGVIFDLGNNEIGAEGAEAISKMELQEGVDFDLSNNKIGDEGAKAIAQNLKLKYGVRLSLKSNFIGDEGIFALSSKMKLRDGVELILDDNNIGLEGVKAIAENMKLEYGVSLSLVGNKIGDEGAKAISKMELKEGVKLNLTNNKIGDKGAAALSKIGLKVNSSLDLTFNKIGDEGAEAIMENMELKEGVFLNLTQNLISRKMRKKLRNWVKSYENKGVNCNILLD